MVPEPRSLYALNFFVLAAALLAVSMGVASVLITQLPRDIDAQPHHFSLAFGISTLMLFLGSGCLFRAVEFVRRERQRQFRLWLKLGLTAGTLFVAVQTYALTCLMRQQPPDEAETGAAALVAVFATLHGMHFVVAFLFLCHVTVQAFADRYDHEYFFGVTVCAWFWHALGVAWLAILFTMFVARFYN